MKTRPPTVNTVLPVPMIFAIAENLFTTRMRLPHNAVQCKIIYTSIRANVSCEYTINETRETFVNA